MSPKIVVVMIVKNEEEMLAQCLDSVKGADAIYITDTGSKDKTIEIAKRYTNNITHKPWNDNFAEARNFAKDQVKEENCYILSIDADEVLKDFSKVREAVDKADGSLTIDCILIDKQSGQKHYFPRLFKKCPEVWWEGAIHNHISVRPKYTSEVEITYGYSPAHKLDPNRAFRILQKEVARTNNPREMFYLGREYWYRNMYRDAKNLMDQYVLRSKFAAEKAEAYLITARCCWAMGLGDDARDACSKALIINPHFKEAVIFMSTLTGKGSGNPAWEKNALQWDEMAKTADNSNVLFIREIDK